MNEHRWRFKVGSRRFDDYRATTSDGAPSVQVLVDGEWIHWTGEPVAGEILRLAEREVDAERWQAKAEQRGREIVDFSIKLQELLDLADELDAQDEPGCECAQCQMAVSTAAKIRSILRLPG